MQNKSPASKKLRVGVVGATGKMGRELCGAILDDAELELVATVARRPASGPIGDLIGRSGGPAISTRLDALTSANAQVAVDFTQTECVMANARWYAKNGLHAVIGTTGFTPENLEELQTLASASSTHIIAAPNLSLTGVLMLHAAKIAAQHLDEVELSDISPPTKAKLPSGTVITMAHALAQVRDGRPGSRSTSAEVVRGARGGVVDNINMHSFSLSGSVGSVEARFAHRGDTLSINVTNHSRAGYAAGTIIAVKAVSTRPGFTYGFESILDLDP